jgi:hypothetical protein
MPQVLVRQYGPQIEPNFVHTETIWPKFPTVERLPLQKTSHYSFSPFLENEGAISGTYNIINTVFQEELGYDCEKGFEELLYLVFGDLLTAFSLADI